MLNGATDAYKIRNEDFADEVLVCCPKCGGKGLVQAKDFDEHNIDKSANSIRFICYACFYNQKWSSIPKIPISKNSKGEVLYSTIRYVNAACDPYFGYSVWLYAIYKTHLIWAYNEAHLQFITEFIAAPLRARNHHDNQNRSIGSRLPKWMTAAKQREKILKVLQQIKAKVDLIKT